jgi:23S rRNA (uridine2552-2'-O)-methyltransferase
LLEIDEKVKVFRKGMRVIDVGAAPGGWSQVIAEKVDSVKGAESVVAVDLLEMMPVDGVHFVQGNIEDEEV